MVEQMHLVFSVQSTMMQVSSKWA